MRAWRALSLGLLAMAPGITALAQSAPPQEPATHKHAPKKPAAHKPAPPPADAARQEAARQLAAAEQARRQKEAAAEAARKQQEAAAAREARLAQQRARTTDTLRDIEQRVDNAASALADAAAAERDAEDKVAERTEDLAAMLPMAMRMSEYPAETLLAAPGPPEKALEGLLATKGLSQDVVRQVQDLRAEQANAARLRKDVAQKQAVLQSERAHQARIAKTLDQQIGAAQQVEAVAGEEGLEATQAASVLAERADDLRSAIAAMDQAERDAQARAAAEAAAAEKRAREQEAAAEQQRVKLAAAAERARKLAAAHQAASAAEQARREEAAAHAAQLAAAQQQEAAKQKQVLDAKAAAARAAVAAREAGPGLAANAARITLVTGRIAKPFGAPAEDGRTTGITFSAAPAAFVSAPCTGRVGFAAPFRSYGKLMIIECGKGYDFVVAGLDRLDVSVGKTVRAGEPVGRMPDYDPAHGGERPGLYVELRRNGTPVDPVPYLSH